MAFTTTSEVPPVGGDHTEEVPAFEGEIEHPRKQWFKRKPIIIIGCVVVVAGGLGIWHGTSSSSATPALQVTSEVVSVTTGTMKQTVSTSGTIEPASQASLNFAVSGKVTAVNVAAGQKVVAGEVLATLDDSALQAEVASAQASLTSAQAKLVSDESSDAEASQIDSDTASVTSAQTQLTSAQTDLGDATLTSTIAGTVASVDLSVGEEVSASGGTSGSSASTGSGATSTGSSAATTGSASTATSSTSSSSSSSAQVMVVSTDSYLVSGTVDDTQVGQVKQNDQAVITPSGSSTTVYGTVSSVGLIASTTSDVATFPITIAVTGSPSGLYAGSTATVAIIVKQLNDVVEIPTAAISYSGGKSTVTAVEDGKHVVSTVTTGEALSGETQITSGLKAGDKIVERVVKFNGTAGGGGRSLFGGSGTTSSGGSGGFPAGGTGGAGSFSGGSAPSGGGFGG
jgi:macrolide-specific efflux system membrane fusion protein